MQVTPSTPITLNVTLDKLNLILGSLSLQQERVNTVLTDLQQQAAAQLQAMTAPAESPVGEQQKAAE